MPMTSIHIIKGPNLNHTGRRETGIYGTTSFEDFLEALRARYPDLSIDLFQSNVEGELIDALQAADGRRTGVILNAGGYTHTSVAIRDAVAAVGVPVIEVHMSSILAREEFRHTSLLAGVCRGTIMGFGMESYRLAVEALIQRAE